MQEEILKSADHLRVNELQNGKIQFTDATNAERLLREHKRDIRYFIAWKKWLVWNGTNWKTDEGGALIHQKGLITIRNIYQEMLKTYDSREKMEIENFGRISECIKKREDMITKLANVEYDPKADCPLWKKFISEIMNYKPELITFLQTATGWSLSGDISEQTMFILYGTGANGKSTFLNTIMYILGDYATSTFTETFMKKSMDVIGNFISKMCVQKKGIKINIRILYKAYSEWCGENNEHAVSERFFTLRLKEIGFCQCRSATERFWVGVGEIERG